jgi:hypothetical protein
MEEDFYQVQVRCLNCNFTGELSLPPGRPVKETLCPNCSCVSLLTVTDFKQRRKKLNR